MEGQGETPGCGQIAVKNLLGLSRRVREPEAAEDFKEVRREVRRWPPRHYSHATKNNTVTMASVIQARRFQSHTRRPLKETKMEKGRSTSKSASI